MGYPLVRVALEQRWTRWTAAQLAADVNAIEQELIAIRETEFVPAGPQSGGDGAGGNDRSTTTMVRPVTTTTTDTGSTTSTTSPSPAPSTTAPAAPTTTAAAG